MKSVSVLREQLRKLLAFAARPSVGAGARNAIYNVSDQMATPVLMVVAARFLTTHMGFEQFGVWVLVLALTGSLAVFNFGLGDATIKFISQDRGTGNMGSVARTFRVNLTMGTLLGVAAALALLLGAPMIARHVFGASAASFATDVHAIDLGGLILALRSVESILANTLRAFEDYAGAARVSVCVKIGIVGSAVGLVALGYGVVAILLATVACVIAGLVAYMMRVRTTIQGVSFLPEFDSFLWRRVSSFGFYSWAQSLAAVLFNQGDKLVVGALLGTAAVARYAICTQVASVVQIITAAAFNFLFPQFSRRYEAGETSNVRRIFRLGMATNLALAAILAIPLLLAGKFILTLWMGRAFAEQSYILLAVLTVGYAWLAVNVVPYLALLGFGKIRFVCIANVIAGVASVAGSALLIPAFGLIGAGLGRLAYGAIVTVYYFEVARTLQRGKVAVAPATAFDRAI
jgi:O-antigen/teichoic acid export membrane protein